MSNFGRYLVEGELGRGSMGVVYLANDPQIRRRVAIKTVNLPDGLSPDERDEFRARFLREAQAAGSLSHPGIVTIYGVEALDSGDQPFIAMEYVAGRNLQHVLHTEGRLVPERAFWMVMNLAEALQTAHAAGIVHRDIKPANILVRDIDGMVKIADFGVARVPLGDLTRENGFLGSPSYMAPEQIRYGQADARSDLFSLAVCLFECLTGERLYSGDDLITITHRVTSEPVPQITRRVRILPPSADLFFLRALAKDPDERFQTAVEFREALNALMLELEIDRAGSVAPTSTLLAAKRGPIAKVASAIPWKQWLNDPKKLGFGIGGLVIASLALIGLISLFKPDAAQGSSDPPAQSAATQTGSATGSTPGADRGTVLPQGGASPWAMVGPSPPAASDASSAETEPKASAAEAEAQAEQPTLPNATAPKSAVTQTSPPPKAAPAAKTAKPTRVSKPEPKAEATATGEEAVVAEAADAAGSEPVAVTQGATDAEAAAAGDQGEAAAIAATDASLSLTVASKVKAGILTLQVDGIEVFRQDLEQQDKKFKKFLNKVAQRAQQVSDVTIAIPAGAHKLTARLEIAGKATVSESSVEIDLDAGVTQAIVIQAGKKFGMGNALRLKLIDGPSPRSSQ